MANEQTSPDVASIAARGLRDPAALTPQEVQAVCASALNQAPDRKEPPMSDPTLQAQDDAAAAVAVAPRVTLEDLEANIVSVNFFTAGQAAVALDQPALEPLHLLTLCVLVLKNGFTVTGESACASPENFDADLGRTIALRHAKEKIWPLMGYSLRDRLSAG